MIALTHGLNTHQRIVGNEEILDTVLVVEAKAAAASLTQSEAYAMLRALLEERFQIRWRLQPRDIDGFLLVPARDDGRPAAGLRSFTGDCDARSRNTGVRFESPEYNDKAPCRWVAMNGRQRANGVSMAAIAERLTRLMAAPVSDGTGWPGLFSFEMVADTRDMPGGLGAARGLGAPVPVDGPYLLEVFRRELGLRLVRNRVTINDFVIDRIEPLIEN